VIGPAGRIAVGSALPPLHANAIKDPSFRIAPYRPDSLVDGWEAGPFVVRGASVRGDAHRYYGVPRQDEMGLAWSAGTGMLVVAVADGVSAAALSHLGASVACRYAVEYFLRDRTDAGGVDWAELLDGCAWAIVEAGQRLRALPQPDPRQAEQDLATTLCVVVVTPAEAGATVRAVAVGDSGVAVIGDGQLAFLLGGKAPAVAGITDNSVVPLPRVPVEVASGEWALHAGETLLVGTDGIWDPVGDGNGAVAHFLVGALSGCLPDRTDFLRVVDFYRDTHDDDRTLVAVRLADPATEITEPPSCQT
jgi:serine/threonine protein phosphatase PrpC